VATQAQQVYLVLIQHSRVRRSVRGMAYRAAFNLRLVLIDKRPLLVHVALVANFILPNRRAQLLSFESPMRIVAITALDQPFIHPVMKRARELRSYIQVAAVAELGRVFLQKEFSRFRVMRGMAIDAGYATLQMG